MAERYPSVEAFEKDFMTILQKADFSEEQAEFIAPKIAVDPSRGAGHAWGSEMKSDKSHLRTRVPKDDGLRLTALQMQWLH